MKKPKKNKKLIGKAENLDLLSKIFKNKEVIIPKYFYFSITEFLYNKNFFFKKIFNFSKKKKIIIRSSSTNEDNVNFSNAGKYESKILDKKSSVDLIIRILERFIKQFKSKNDKIIIQEFLSSVDYSGVIFTKDINYDSPYYTINFDTSGKTDLITSGKQNDKINSFVIYKNHKKNNKFYELIKTVSKIESVTKNDRLDIEFALKNNKVILFQVRPLPKPKYKVQTLGYKEKNFDKYLKNIEKKIKKLKSVNPTLSSKQTFFSNMSDWNPAEMIGDKPTPLAISLYRELITDEIWREQRTLYGYKNVSPNPLLFSFAGSPYVDLRTDISSFIPSTLDKKKTTKIVNKYLKIISHKPEIHDKIEFELVETCYSFLSEKRLNKLFSQSISKVYLKEIKILTKKIIKYKFFIDEINKTNLLKKKLDEIQKNKSSNIQKIYHIINLTKNFGTLPFSGLARCAFISQRILLDLKELKLISNNEFENYFNSLNSTTTEFNNDFNKLNKNQLKKKSFIIKYGHLRPSAYDINNLNYKEGFNLYFSSKKKVNKKLSTKHILQFKNKNKINSLFKKNLGINFKNFLNFSSNSIIFREKAKLEFSRGINLLFEHLIQLGKRLNISRKNLSYLDLKSLINLYSSVDVVNLKKILLKEIKINKFEYDIMKLIKLPDFIKTEKDVYRFYDNIIKPNFITLNYELGEVIELKNYNLSKIKGKIVMIKNADPGFDYIFNHDIKGLITEYGGANSHMAIRCLELNIPAAIGVGKFQFEKIIKSKKIILDCVGKKIELIK